MWSLPDKLAMTIYGKKVEVLVQNVTLEQPEHLYSINDHLGLNYSQAYKIRIEGVLDWVEAVKAVKDRPALDLLADEHSRLAVRMVEIEKEFSALAEKEMEGTGK